MRSNFPSRDSEPGQYLAAAVVVAGAVALGLVLACAPRQVRALSKEAGAAGAAVFHDKGCQHCHGDDATGTDRGPDLSTVGKKWHKDRIEQQIREGGNGMPAFGDLLKPDEMAALVNFLGAKRKPAPGRKNGPAAPPPPAAKSSNDDSGF